MANLNTEDQEILSEGIIEVMNFLDHIQGRVGEAAFNHVYGFCEDMKEIIDRKSQTQTINY